MNSRALMRAVLPAILVAAWDGCAPLAPPAPPPPAAPAPPEAPSPPRPLSLCGGPESGFIRNRGEFPAEVLYYAKGREGAICFTRAAVLYPAGRGSPGGGLALRFDGAGAGTEPRTEKGARSGDAASPVLTYRNLYPGIDCEFRAGGGGIERAFMADPGADPGIIRLVFEGAARVAIAPDGGLLISTPHGCFTEPPPRARQYASGEKVAVPAQFFPAGDRTIGYALGRRDPRYLLVIDSAAAAEGGAR